MKIYTRAGDSGETSLHGGDRVSKSDARVEAYGTVDELNAALGLAASLTDDDAVRSRISATQARLLDLGADIATPDAAAAAVAGRLTRADASWASDLEADIDAMAAELAPLRSFILPGGHPSAAALHSARTVCRRAERRLFGAVESGAEVNEHAAVYLNRLSDWLFTLARFANARAGVPDEEWRPPRSR
ncbi:MAG: cob(I)yrinic acid a,c-diamide adenosyltransferase [Anaerolineae bacterium]